GAPGTSITFSSMTDPGTVDVGPAGANQTWNFTGMTTVFTQTHEYHDPATTSWGASFPNANRCFKIADITPEMFHYFELTTTDYWTLGFGSDMMTINYNNTQSLVQFPVEYQDEWDCVYTWDMEGTTIYDSTRYVVDGYGTVIDGSNTYNNVLRTRSHRTAITYVMGIPISTMTYWSYAWEEVGYGSVASITSEVDESNPNFTTGTFARIESITGIKELPAEPSLPTAVTLHPAYPNPFNPETLLRFSIPVAGEVMLTIYDLHGRVVTQLQNGWLTPGTYQTQFNGESLAGGIYFAQLKANNMIQMEKLVLVK
ncbi:T9SS type A sorting domain-containing protein, partial [bacterium]|nr:T9SS type A sorting domain-containing protein [bacterium]